MRIDELVVNGNDVGEVVGEFHGTPIRELNLLKVDLRNLDDTQQRARAGLGIESAPVDLLPGETIKDNIIRRTTTAEVVGEEFYKAEVPEGRKVPIEEVPEGVMVTWRPNGQEYGIVHEEVSSELPLSD